MCPIYNCAQTISPQIIKDIKKEIEFLMMWQHQWPIHDQLESVKTGLSLAIKYDLVTWYSELLEGYQMNVDQS